MRARKALLPNARRVSGGRNCATGSFSIVRLMNGQQCRAIFRRSSYLIKTQQKIRQLCDAGEWERKNFMISVVREVGWSLECQRRMGGMAGAALDEGEEVIHLAKLAKVMSLTQ